MVQLAMIASPFSGAKLGSFFSRPPLVGGQIYFAKEPERLKTEEPGSTEAPADDDDFTFDFGEMP